MRRVFFLAIFGAALASVGARANDPQPPSSNVDPPALEKRVADLERQLAAAQKELQDIRRELRAQAKPKIAALTPQQAVNEFERNPNQPLTVEFGVESAGWLDGPIRVGDDPMPPIRADWDCRLQNGGMFTLFLTGKAIRGLNDVGVELPTTLPDPLVDTKRVSVLCKRLKGKGVRVTGLLQASRPGDKRTDYCIVVDDPANFKINK